MATRKPTRKVNRRQSLMMKKSGVTRNSRPYKCGGKLKKK